MTEKEKYKLSTYEPVKVIRETEASKVELAECSLDGKKYIKKTYHSDKRAVFNIIADIKNEHMPKIYEIFFGEDTIIIEQYIEGKTLAQEISEGKVFSKARIKSVFGDLTEAVDALHKNNIVHRDIKPSNIIIKENGDAVLIDYSIARPYSDKRNADTELFGTVGYAAPEQFGFSQSDFRTDIYALGVTMKEIANRHNTSKRLYSAISRCTEFDPSRRFQTIDELRKYLNGTKKHIAVGTAVCLTAVSVFAVICVCLNSVKGKDDLNELSEQYEQTLQASVSESETEITTSEVTTSQDRHYENVKTADVIYKPSSARIVNTSFVRDGVPCIKMWEDGSYKAEIPVGDDAPPIRISAEKKDSK
ncbi:MAG: serine/threonine-protein kinase, partial [Oscillospiraceae bacterium]